MTRLTALLLLAPLGISDTQSPVSQTEADAYTRYELLAPGSGKFRIFYDVTATAAGARYYFNPIRKGSVATDESVTDPATGRPLRFDEVDGATARTQGLPSADLDTRYIRVELPRPVAEGGEIRVRIDKTYEDAKSYFEDAGEIVFARSLGIKRNAVVLPAGYDLVRCNVPSQVLTEADGRIAISFLNAGPDAASLTLEGPADSNRRCRSAGVPGPAPLRARQPDSRNRVLPQQPETHAFDLYHDYTETREGVDKYLNVVRAGSTVANPAAVILDTGEKLTTRSIKGDAITKAGLDMAEPVTPQSEVVVISFPKVEKGHSTRLRISETYTDPARYRLEGDQLIWDRGFGRPFNAVVLPAGWLLTHSAVPATVSTMPDGRVRLDFVNPRLDDIQVLIVARRRGGPRP